MEKQALRAEKMEEAKRKREQKIAEQNREADQINSAGFGLSQNNMGNADNKPKSKEERKESTTNKLLYQFKYCLKILIFSIQNFFKA